MVVHKVFYIMSSFWWKYMYTSINTYWHAYLCWNDFLEQNVYNNCAEFRLTHGQRMYILPPQKTDAVWCESTNKFCH